MSKGEKAAGRGTEKTEKREQSLETGTWREGERKHVRIAEL